MIAAFVADLKDEFKSLNGTTQTLAELKNHFAEFIPFYADAKQLSTILKMNVFFKITLFPISHFVLRYVEKLGNIYEFILTTNFLWRLLAICGALTILQRESVQ